MLTTREYWYAAVFLQHLPSLSQLQNFPEIWLGTFDFMDNFLHLDNSDLLVSLQYKSTSPEWVRIGEGDSS